MRKQALFSALSGKLKEGQILVVKDLKKVAPKTKLMAQLVEKLVWSKDAKKKKATIVVPSVIENIDRGARNLKKVKLAQASLLNTYEVLNGGQLVLMEESIDQLKETFLKKKAKWS